MENAKEYIFPCVECGHITLFSTPYGGATCEKCGAGQTEPDDQYLIKGRILDTNPWVNGSREADITALVKILTALPEQLDVTIAALRIVDPAAYAKVLALKYRENKSLIAMPVVSPEQLEEFKEAFRGSHNTASIVVHDEHISEGPKVTYIGPKPDAYIPAKEHGLCSDHECIFCSNRPAPYFFGDTVEQEPTEFNIRRLITWGARRGKTQALKVLLQDFGVRRGSELTPEQWPTFGPKIKQILIDNEIKF